MIYHRGRAQPLKSSDKLETFWAASMDKGVGNHELISHHTMGTSNSLMELGRTNEMDKDEEKIIAQFL